MDCTLFIPHLIPATEHGQAPWRAPQCDQLKSLLARAAMVKDTSVSAEGWLCTAFGVARQNDWPLAPIFAAADGLPAHSGYWLRAMPAHLEPRRDALVLMDFASLNITAQESAALAQTLAAHLHEYGIMLHAPPSGRWYLQLPLAPALQTFTAEVALNHDVRDYLPQGADALAWHRTLTEMQMLLHAHPVNEAREARGLPPINSIWLASGGALPPPERGHYDVIWSSDPAVHALSAHAGCAASALAITSFQQLAGKGNLLITLETLAAPALRGDEASWRDAMQALEHEWIAPLMQVRRSQRIRSITLVSTNRDGIHQFVACPWDAFKFWRKNRYL